MHLQQKIEPILLQLVNTLQELTDEQYTQKCSQLNGSSIGGHTRHVIELFQCLIDGYQTGIVNYELRKRDTALETNKNIASIFLKTIVRNILLDNKKMQLEGLLSEDENENKFVETNFNRELIYNLEHCIHHKALIRIAINEVSNIILPENFGVAASTIKHKKLCAQ